MPRSLIDFIVAALFVWGILLAGCESAPPWWPWTNLMGALLLVAAYFLAAYFISKPKS